MPRRRKLLLATLASCSLLIIAGFAWYGLTRPSFAAAFAKIRGNMPRASVEELMKPFGAGQLHKGSMFVVTSPGLEQMIYPTGESKPDSYAIVQPTEFLHWQLGEDSISVGFDSHGNVCQTIRGFAAPTWWDRARDWLHDKLGL